MTQDIKIQLYGAVEGYLSITETSDFPFTLALADIKDVSKRKSTASKSIKLGGTDNNNRILGYYFDVNIDNLTFDINKIQKCVIIINDDVFMDNCIMQLTEIKKVKPNTQYEYNIEYTINIKSNQADFFGNIQNKFLDDIQFTEQDIPGNGGAGFVYNATFVKNSFNNTYTDGYKFLYQKTTNGKITLPMFKAGIYHWQYFNRIIKDAGFRYTFPEIGVTNSVLTNPTRDDLKWRKLIVPFTNSVVGATQYNVTNYAASAAKTGSAITINGYTVSSGFNLIPSPNSLTTPQIAVGLELNDPSNSYNTGTSSYTAPFTGQLDVKIGSRYQAYVNNFNAFDIFTYTGVQAGYAKIKLRHIIYKNGVSTGIEAVVGNVTIDPTPHTFTASVRTSVGLEAPSVTIPVPVIAGDVISVRTGFFIEEGTGNKRYRMVDATPAAAANWRIEVDIQTMTLEFFATIPNAGQVFGGIIDMNNFIPQKIKQSEYLKSILNMYNVFVYADPSDENLLHFTTRDNYYDTGSIKNFTQKQCWDLERTEEFLADISNKEMYFAYKQDKYIDNEDYFKKYQKTYGSATFVFDNEYVKEQDKLEVIFSPSPINRDGDKFVTDLTTADSLRILYDAGEVSCNSFNIVNYAGNEVASTTYPLTTHYDNPDNPTYDLNWGTASAYYHSPYTSLTNNNLLNNYWRRTLHQINTSRLVTMYFNLSEIDIKNIKLNDIIYIENSYFYINKIIDFNPAKTYKTKVELISIDDLQKTTKGVIINLGDTKPVEPWVPTPNGGTVKPNVYGNIVRNFDNGNAGATGGIIGVGNIADVNSTVIGDNNSVDGKGTTVVGHTNVVRGNMTKVLGERNMITGDNVAQSGEDSTIIAKNVISNGDNNMLESPGIYLGSGITAPSNLGNVLVVGDNITPTSGGVWADSINGIPATSLTTGLPGVLSIDNTTGPNAIVLSAGGASPITSSSGNSTITMDAGILNTMQLNVVAGAASSNILFRPGSPAVGVRMQTINGSNSGRMGVSSTSAITEVTDGSDIGRATLSTSAVNLTSIGGGGNQVTSVIVQPASIETQMDLISLGYYSNTTQTIYQYTSSIGDGIDLSVIGQTSSSYTINVNGPILTVGTSNITLDYVPVTDNTNLKVLARNAVSGNLEEVDISAIVPGAQDLAVTLANGNTTGANDIIIDTTQVIKSGNGGGQINLDATGAADLVTISTDNGALGESYLYMNPTSLYLQTPNMQLIGDTSLFIDSPIVRLVQTPTTDNTNTMILTRDTVTGNIELRDVSTIVTAPQDLDSVLTVGNITGGNNIVMTVGDLITSADATSSLNLDSNFTVLGFDNGAGINGLVGMTVGNMAFAYNDPTFVGSLSIDNVALNLTYGDNGGPNAANLFMDQGSFYPSVSNGSDSSNMNMTPSGVDIAVNGSGYDYAMRMNSSGIYFIEGIGGDIPLLVDTHGTTFQVGMNIAYTPVTNNSNLLLLSRNASTGDVEQVAISALPGVDKYATTANLAAGNNTITHSLGTADIQVVIYDSTGVQVIPDQVFNPTTTQVTIRVSTSMSSARVIVIG